MVVGPTVFSVGLAAYWTIAAVVCSEQLVHAVFMEFMTASQPSPTLRTVDLPLTDDTCNWLHVMSGNSLLGMPWPTVRSTSICLAWPLTKSLFVNCPNVLFLLFLLESPNSCNIPLISSVSGLVCIRWRTPS